MTEPLDPYTVWDGDAIVLDGDEILLDTPVELRTPPEPEPQVA